MRAGTNSVIHALKQRCLAPAFGCDARRALRRVVALGPHIPVLRACISVSSHCTAETTVAHRVSSYRRALRLVCRRSEEHTSELQSLMRISYAVFCLKKKTPKTY